jgi:GT2 family glycosyltransferase
MMTESPQKRQVTVVIVNWERPEDTIECIQSVLASQCVSPQVLVVDNGSRDDSVQRISSIYPEIEIIQLEHNLGFAGGYNAGIERALEMQAADIFLLNNDAIVEPETTAALVNAPWDVAVPKILYYDQPERIWAAGSRWRAFPPAVVMIGYRKMDGAAYQTAYPLEYATGCALLIRREVFEEVQGFDSEFGNYMEDYDFTYRVRAAGFKMGYVPEARVRHKVSQSLGEASPLRWQYLGRNTVFFYRKDERFSTWTLPAYLAWFLLRETVKGQVAHLPHFFKGVRQGLAVLNRKETSRRGKRKL